MFIQELKNISKRYFINLFIAVDQLVNTIFYGDPDETISSRLGKNYPNSKFTKFVDWLFSWQNKEGGHTKASIEHDEGNQSILK